MLGLLFYIITLELIKYTKLIYKNTFINKELINIIPIII